MNDIFDSYYNITVLDGTLNCTDIILSNLNNANGVKCTKPEDVRACFNYVSGPWQLFVRDCELFTAAPSCVQSGTTKCAKPVATDPWWVHLLGALWRTNTYNYGTGVVPNHGEGWQSYAAAEGEGSRRLHRRLLQDSESEGGGSGSSAGCFPDFYTAQDFDDWLQGTYQAPVFGANYSINPVGIILWLVHAAGILSMAAF
ncbi:g11659 [Coccomyxa viridis]|uniref:G11659 protein n=1 Tax=Coccomyxa viridis TaxID=1274662 RepID=A0ABP1GB54_9CHLO